MKIDLSIVYYTSNWLETANPYFLNNTKNQLLKAADGLPIISVSHKPMDFGHNICVGDIGRSHLNIYRQILRGCQEAWTDYVAMAEDDILYSHEHFHPEIPDRWKGRDMFIYDMAKLSIFTWTNPPLLSFRNKRRVVNHLIVPRLMMIEYLNERFDRINYLIRTSGRGEDYWIKYWGDPGRYDTILGVKPREVDEIFSDVPGIVFTHEHAFGYLNHGRRKRLGDIRIIEVPYWGKAEDLLRLYYEK